MDSSIEVTLKKINGGYQLYLLPFHSQKMGSIPQVIENSPEFSNQKLALYLRKKVRGIIDPQSGNEISFTESDNGVEFILSAIKGFTILNVEINI